MAKTRLGLVLNISVVGALFLARTKLTVNDLLEVDLYLASDPTPSRTVRGRVVRVQPVEPADYWRWKVAMAFEEPMVDAEPILAQIEERQLQRSSPGRTRVS